jgi:cephalosporin hydroxylase
MKTTDDALLIAQMAMKLGAAQIEDELRQAVALVVALRPAVIVEIGCLTGGTLYAWRQACERVYGITLTENYKYLGGDVQHLESHGAVVHCGDSHDSGSREWLLGQLDGSPVDVLVIDADHRFDAVKQDLMTYAPLVKSGGVILIHDVLLRPANFGDDEFQVWRLWDQLQECCDTSVIGTEVGWGVIRVRPDDDFAALASGMKFAEPGTIPA